MLSEQQRRLYASVRMTDGKVSTTWQAQIDSSGEFVRHASKIRERVTSDGSSGFRAESGRYHLYVSYACPWAHRALITRKLKGLEEAISVDVVHSFLGEHGWSFDSEEEGATGDRVNGFRYLRDAYAATLKDYVGSITVPVLWDKQEHCIVNNESADIIVMLNGEFQQFAKHPERDYYPLELRGRIEEVNEWIYHTVNNGVYRAGFARSQEAYERAARQVFVSLDRIEGMLSESRYLCGNQLTLADIRLFTTLVRFDAVYNTHFKCNLRRLVDYPNTWGFARDIYAIPGVAETVNMQHIRDHYYKSHEAVNPFRIVPIGPEIDFTAPHDRAKFG